MKRLALLQMAGQVASPQLIEFFVQCDMGLPARSKSASYEGKGEVTLLKLAEGVPTLPMPAAGFAPSMTPVRTNLG